MHNNSEESFPRRMYHFLYSEINSYTTKIVTIQSIKQSD